MNTAAVVLIVYGVCAGVDSYAAGHGKRRFLKPVLMPLLSLYYVLAMHPAFAGAVSAASAARSGNPLYHVTVVIALLCGWAGDCFLLGKREFCFPAGLLAFLAGHLVYLYTFIMDAVRRPYAAGRPWNVVIVMAIGIAGYSWLIRTVKKKLIESVPEKLRGAFFAYVTVIALMSFAALCRLAFLGGFTALAWIGSLLFIVSDLILAYQTFCGRSGKGIMETYALAQALIILGMMM